MLGGLVQQGLTPLTKLCLGLVELMLASQDQVPSIAWCFRFCAVRGLSRGCVTFVASLYLALRWRFFSAFISRSASLGVRFKVRSICCARRRPLVGVAALLLPPFVRLLRRGPIVKARVRNDWRFGEKKDSSELLDSVLVLESVVTFVSVCVMTPGDTDLRRARRKRSRIAILLIDHASVG